MAFSQDQIYEGAKRGDWRAESPWYCACEGKGFFISNVDTLHECKAHSVPGWFQMFVDDEEIGRDVLTADEAERLDIERQQLDRQMLQKWRAMFAKARGVAGMSETKQQRDEFTKLCESLIAKFGYTLDASNYVGAAMYIAD